MRVCPGIRIFSYFLFIALHILADRYSLCHWNTLSLNWAKIITRDISPG
jgi:hypothetical protein